MEHAVFFTFFIIIHHLETCSSSSLRINDEGHLESIWIKNHPEVFHSMRANQTKEDKKDDPSSLIDELRLNETQKTNSSSSEFNSKDLQTADLKIASAPSNKSDSGSRDKNHTNHKGKELVSMPAMKAMKSENNFANLRQMYQVFSKTSRL